MPVCFRGVGADTEGSGKRNGRLGADVPGINGRGGEGQHETGLADVGEEAGACL